MLNVSHISTGYDKKQVLFDLSLSIAAGEVVLLAGSNGSGKSTLLKAIYGVLQVWGAGRIDFAGTEITREETSGILAKGLLYIPQKGNLFEDLTVKENLEMAGLTIPDKAVLNSRIKETLDTFSSVAGNLKKKAWNLSGGERQLLTLAMANLHRPKMILCDEPFIGLSPQNIKFVLNTLKALNNDQKTTFLIVEHHIKEAITIADRVIGLKLGQLFLDRAIDDTFDINELQALFI
jgi:branched-chain amino acid transport system ATP-binding protein